MRYWALLLYSSAAFGQVNGAVTGIVSDSSQSVIAGAEVSLTLTQTGVVTRTISNEAGVFRFPSVPIGVYELTVSSSGFKRFVQQNLSVETGQTVRVDVALEVGAAQESITVTAEAVQLDKERSTVGTQVSTDMVSTLPYQLTGSIRNPFAFVRLTPGAAGQSGAGDGIRIAGSRTYANEVFLDGVPFSYNASQNVAGPAAPAIETVAEFRVEAAVPPAEFGRTAGGAVLMASRSGTNAYHGNVFLFLRNNVFDARRYNAAIADVTRQGEFGATLGGPIKRNRTFFFFNYTGFRRINEAQGRTATIATEAMRRGDFSAVDRIFDPASVNAAGQRQQFPGNQIPASRVSPFAAKFQALIPLPNAAGNANNFLGGIPSTLNMTSFFIKVDHTLNERHRLNGSYRSRDEDRLNNNGFVLPVSDYIRQSVYPKNIVIGYDLILRSNLVNRMQLGANRFFSPLTESGDVGLSVPGAFAGGFPGVRFAGQGLTGFGYGADRNTANNNYSLQETLSWTRGKHNVKFGGRIDVYQFNQGTFGFREGQYTFSQFGTSQPQVARTGHSYASLLLGLVNNGTMALNAPTGDRSKYFGIFAQDDWKITRRLTLNYGYRYEVQIPWSEAHRRLSIMDPRVPNPGAPGMNGAVIFTGDGPGRSGLKNFILTDFGAHGPRFGLAYQLGSRTVVRAGAGLFYSPLIGIDNNKQGFNASITVGSQDGGLTPAFLIDQGWPAGLVQFPPFIDATIANNQNVSTLEFRRGGSGRLSRTSQYQFSLQHMIAGMVLESSYIGTLSHGVTNGSLVNPNQLPVSMLSLGSLLTRNITDPAVIAQGFRPPYPGFRGTLAQSQRLLPQYQTVSVLDTPTGNSTYHALFLKAERRLSRGLQFLASYALSKSISDIGFTNAELARPQDQGNRRAEKSITDIDVPQRLTLSFGYELPFGGLKGIARHLLHGWLVSGIVAYEAGGTIRITAPNGLPIFNGHLRPNRVGTAPIRLADSHGEFEPINGLNGQTGDLFLNRDAFAVPAPFTLGTLGVVLPDIRAFGSRNEDFSLLRRFRVKEGMRAEFRVDMFNALNRRNLADPIADLSNPNFGRITGQDAARIMQLGLRFDF